MSNNDHAAGQPSDSRTPAASQPTSGAVRESESSGQVPVPAAPTGTHRRLLPAEAAAADDPAVLCDYCATHPGAPLPKPMCVRCARLADDVLEFDGESDIAEVDALTLAAPITQKPGESGVKKPASAITASDGSELVTISSAEKGK